MFEKLREMARLEWGVRDGRTWHDFYKPRIGDARVRCVRVMATSFLEEKESIERERGT